MAVSILTFYTTEITPERNARVDALEQYLSDCNKMTVGNFQYKTIKLDDTIKINWNQQELPNFPFNYLSIKRSDDINNKTYYYFVLNSNWRAQDTVELQISLDTINTFWNDLNWTAKTNITRQHKDRFLQKTIPTTGNVRLQRIVDNFDEGISPIQYKLAKEKITTDLDLDFYLIYRTNPDAEQTLECLCCASDRLQLGANAPTTNGIRVTDIPVGQSIIILGEENSSFIIGDALIGEKSGHPGVYIERNDDSTMSLYTIDKEKVTGAIIQENVTNVTLTAYVKYNLMSKQYAKNFLFLADAKYAVKHDTVASYTINSTYVSDFSTIDRTDTKLVKIIKMPYAPFELTKNAAGQLVTINGFYEQDHLLHLYNLNQEFLTTVANQRATELIVDYPVAQIAPTTARVPSLESKLLNSNFYTRKYIYDSFEKSFLLERSYPMAGATEAPYINILFKQSNNISSNSLFDIQMVAYDEPTTYSEYLNVNRQNEVALYTNDYLNYIRTGFNFEKKQKATQTTAQWIGFGVSLAGSVASFAAGAVSGAGAGVGIAAGISLATSAVASLTAAISNTISSEVAMAQKLSELQKQSSAVSNTEDLNLLSYYNGNRLLMEQDIISDNLQHSIYELFTITGYACNDYGIPVFNTRLHYNFVQCKADFDEQQWYYGQEFLDDIKARFQVGVTDYHRVDNTYDWLQEKENFESWMLA